MVLRIENLLSQKKVTAAEMCRACGLNKSTFYFWKKGTSPNVEALVSVSKYLGVSLDYLVTGSEPDAVERIPEDLQQVIDKYAKR